jgi:hypothetical protein
MFKQQEARMKKRMMMVLGAAGIIFWQAPAHVQAALPLAMATRHDPDVSFDARPDFIYLDDYGFYVAWGVPYDLIFFDDYYFLFRDGYWYRSRGYRGPWGRVRNDDLPMTIRRRSWGDIRQRRDTEYRRYDRGFWDNRFRMDRERWRSRDNRNAPEGRPAPGRDRGLEDRREQPGGERDFERRDRR